MKLDKEIIEYSSDNMVTIDELLKDNPQALKELEDLRKWMDENPDQFNFPEEKTTQGSRKMKQLLEDARRDERFRKKLLSIAGNRPKYKPEDLQTLYTLYCGYLMALQAFREEFIFTNPDYKVRKSLCKQFGVDPEILDILRHNALNNRLDGWDFNEESSGDVCVIEPVQKTDGPVDMHNFHLNVVDDIENEVYPINIKLHKFASKRDVLDFVEKRWESIRPYLSAKRVRERKVSRSITDFIWKYRDKKSKEIKSLLDEKFPGNLLVYFDITKIIAEEKRRRGNKEKNTAVQ